MPIGPSSAIICASCPAPLGSLDVPSPSDAPARSMARCTSAEATAGAALIAGMNSIVVCVFAAISRAFARMSSIIATSF